MNARSCAKCVELRAAGWSFDQIRQYLNYQMKARTRLGGEWTTSRISYLVQQGLRLLAETGNGSTDQNLASADDEEDYSDLIQLEDESDD